jgi:hypothetical protein
MKSGKILSEIRLATLTQLAPVPGLSLLLNKRLRRKARRATGFALLSAGALVAVPVALYVICKTSPESTQKN